jgi:hypothetical protein
MCAAAFLCTAGTASSGTLSADVGVNHLRNEELATLFYDGRIWRGGIHMSF